MCNKGKPLPSGSLSLCAVALIATTGCSPTTGGDTDANTGGGLTDGSTQSADSGGHEPVDGGSSADGGQQTIACDPVGTPLVEDLECPDGEGCYWLDSQSSDDDPLPSGCLTVAAGAEDRVQGDACLAPPVLGETYENGCARGYQCLPDREELPYRSCKARCRPADSFKGNDANRGGVAGMDCSAARLGDAAGAVPGRYECRYAQSMWPNWRGVSESEGLCEDTMYLESCANFDWPGMLAVAQQAVSDGKDVTQALEEHCFDDPNIHETLQPHCAGFYDGCISWQLMQTLLP